MQKPHPVCSVNKAAHPDLISQGGWQSSEVGRRLAMLEEESRGRHEALASSLLSLRHAAD